MVKPVLRGMRNLVARARGLAGGDQFEEVLFLDEEQKRALNRSISNFNILAKVVQQQATSGEGESQGRTLEVLKRIEAQGLNRVPGEVEAGERIQVQDATAFMEALGELKTALKEVGSVVEVPLSTLVEELRKQTFVYAENGDQTKEGLKGLYSMLSERASEAQRVISELEGSSKLSEEQLAVLEDHRTYLKKLTKHTGKLEPLLNIDSESLQNSEEMREKLQAIFTEVADDTNEVKMYHQLRNIDGELGRLGVDQDTLGAAVERMKASGKKEIASRKDWAEMAKKPLRGMLDYAMESTGLGFLNELGITDAVGSGVKNLAGMGAGLVDRYLDRRSTRKAVRQGMQDSAPTPARVTVPSSGGQPQPTQTTPRWQVGARQAEAAPRGTHWSVRREPHPGTVTVPTERASAQVRRLRDERGRFVGTPTPVVPGKIGVLEVGQILVRGSSGLGGLAQTQRGSRRSTAAARRLRDSRGRFLPAGAGLVAPELAAVDMVAPELAAVDIVAPEPVLPHTSQVTPEAHHQTQQPAPQQGRFRRVLGGVGRTAAKAARFAGPLGLALSAGFAAKDAFGGWGQAGANFGLAPGAEASRGQKVASAMGGALSGLSFGLLPGDVLAKGLYGAGQLGMGAGRATMELGKFMTRKIKDFGLFLFKLTPVYWLGKGISAFFRDRPQGEESLVRSMGAKLKQFGSFLMKLTPGYWLGKALGRLLDRKQHAKESGETKGILAKVQGYMTEKIKALADFAAQLNPLTWGKKALALLGRGGSAAVGALEGGANWVKDTLGSLSAKHESGAAGTGAVGWDKTGGASYGKYQISTKTGAMSQFLTYAMMNNPDLYKQLAQSGSPTQKGGSFEKTWKKLAEDESGALSSLEHGFVKEKYFAPAFNQLDKESLRSRVSEDQNMQEVLWSTAVQHGSGGAAELFNKVYKEEMNNAELIRALYAERKQQFGGSTQEVRDSVWKRLSEEMLEVLGRIGDTAEEGWDATKGFMQDTWNKIKSFAEGAGLSLATLAQQGIRSTEDLLAKLVENGVSTTEDILAYLKETGGEGLEEIKKLAQAGVNSLGDLIPKLAKLGGAGLKGLLGLVATLSKKAGEFVLDSLDQIGKLFFHEDMNLAGTSTQSMDSQGTAVGVTPGPSHEQFQEEMLKGVRTTTVRGNTPLEQFQDALYQQEGKAPIDPANPFNRSKARLGTKMQGLTTGVNQRMDQFGEWIGGKINKESITGFGRRQGVKGRYEVTPASLPDQARVQIQNPTPGDGAQAAAQFRSQQRQEAEQARGQLPPIVVQPAPQQAQVSSFDRRTQIDDLGLVIMNTDFLG